MKARTILQRNNSLRAEIAIMPENWTGLFDWIGGSAENPGLLKESSLLDM
jgi:hypothetical protein